MAIVEIGELTRQLPVNVQDARPTPIVGSSENRDTTRTIIAQEQNLENGQTRPEINFNTIAVQTDFSNRSSAATIRELSYDDHQTEPDLSNHNQHGAFSNAVIRIRNRLWPRWCCTSTTLCCIVTATVMITVGVTIIVVTGFFDLNKNGNVVNENANKTETQAEKDKAKADKLASIVPAWVIGPIFIFLGGLICVHLLNRLYARCQRRRSGGHFLESDTRQSLAVLPPTYSKALNAKIPSNVVTQENECKTPTTVTDAPPPTYASALNMLRNALPDRWRKKQTTQKVGSRSGIDLDNFRQLPSTSNADNVVQNSNDRTKNEVNVGEPRPNFFIVT